MAVSAWLLSSIEWIVLIAAYSVRTMMGMPSSFHLSRDSVFCLNSCGIAQTSASLFMSLQLIIAVSLGYFHYNRDQVALGCVGAASKFAVAALLLRACYIGFVRWTVGFVGFVDALFGFVFVIELGVEYDQRKRHGKRF